MNEQCEHIIVLNVDIVQVALGEGRQTNQSASFHSSCKVENYFMIPPK